MIQKSTRAIKTVWRKFLTRGAIAHSSKYLAQRMSAWVPKDGTPIVVELGAGIGSLTGEILTQLPSQGKLIAVELNEGYAQKLTERYPDSRLEVLIGDAINLSEILKEKGVRKADCIVSGLPLGNFSRSRQKSILEEIRQVLNPNGTFVQFQYFLASIGNIKQFFSNTEISFEPRNIPPAFVMTCTKPRNQV